MFWSRITFRIWGYGVLGANVLPQQNSVRSHMSKFGIGNRLSLLTLLGLSLLAVNWLILFSLWFIRSHSSSFIGIIIFRYCFIVGMPMWQRHRLDCSLSPWIMGFMPSCTFTISWWPSNWNPSGSTVSGSLSHKFPKWWLELLWRPLDLCYPVAMRKNVRSNLKTMLLLWSCMEVTCFCLCNSSSNGTKWRVANQNLSKKNSLREKLLWAFGCSTA